MQSIHKRITRTLTLASLAWGLAVTAIVWGLVLNKVDDLLDGGLQESAELLFGLLSLNTAVIPAQQAERVLPAPLHDERLVWQLVDADQQVLLRSHRAPLQALLPRWVPGVSDVDTGWRVYGMVFMADQSILYVGQPMKDRSRLRLEAATVSVIGTLGVGLFFMVWLRRRVKSEMVPLQQLSRDVSRYEPLKHTATLAEVTRSELVPIHRAITELGRGLASRVANERAFTAHAAHALRTPLAGMDAQLALALRECTPETRPRLQRTREAANRLARVVSALLTLFRSGVALQWQTVDLTALVSRLPVKDVVVEVDTNACLSADPDLLAAALLNLLDNAVRHGGKAVRIGLMPHTEYATVFVEDDGPGLPLPRQQAIQQALDAQDYETHMGLGLMLAAMVARAHGGDLRLAQVNHGFRVEMRLGTEVTGSTPDAPGPQSRH